MLITHLPPESATKTALRLAMTDEERAAAQDGADPSAAPWSGVELLLAQLRDELVLSRGVAIAAAGGKPPAFQPYPRPGVVSGTTSSRRHLSDEDRARIDPRLRAASE
ncbi:hypothetical protein ADL27_38380 [Streptomyces sp. NRRL F-6602]|nr:hypothetical protein ADL27_38380 [Streptomyces sp. NRRL F-6602]